MLEHIGKNRVGFIHDDNLFENLLSIGSILHNFESNVEFFVKINLSVVPLPNNGTLIFDLIEV